MTILVELPTADVVALTVAAIQREVGTAQAKRVMPIIERLVVALRASDPGPR